MMTNRKQLSMNDHRCGRRHILFLLAGEQGKHVEWLARVLSRHLDQNDYKFDAVVYFPSTKADEVKSPLSNIPGVEIDQEPLTFSVEQTLDYITQKIPCYDAVVLWRNDALIDRALKRLYWRPPLIEYGSSSSEIQNSISNLAVPPSARGGVYGCEIEKTFALRWNIILQSAMRDQIAAPAPSVFASFIQGGFECSTHNRPDGRRLDSLAATGHDVNTLNDYQQLGDFGIATVRDGLRWHLIEQNTGEYVWSSFLPMLRAARSTKTQVIWDLMHYGWPGYLDVWSPNFVRHFARFASNVARVVKSETDAIPFYCPINEISYLAWGGGDAAYLNPFAYGRSFELKTQLVRAAIAAMEEILLVEPRARFVHCEPLIHIVPETSRPGERLEAERARQAQFQAFDMITGGLWPQLGGDPRLLDIVGVNYYPQNQWSIAGPTLSPSDSRSRPFRALISEVYSRYGKPILVAETGTESDGRAAWFASIISEVVQARRAGIPVEGACLYPIIDHVGWENDRICPSGLLANRAHNGIRATHAPLADLINHYRHTTII